MRIDRGDVPAREQVCCCVRRFYSPPVSGVLFLDSGISFFPGGSFWLFLAVHPAPEFSVLLEGLVICQEDGMFASRREAHLRKTRPSLLPPLAFGVAFGLAPWSGRLCCRSSC